MSEPKPEEKPEENVEPKPEKIARPGIYCHSCGKRGHVFESSETVVTSFGDLDLPSYRCENCDCKWYDAADVIPLVVIYRMELEKK